MSDVPELVPQEAPYDAPESKCSFQPETEGLKFVAWPGAIEAYSLRVIVECLELLQGEARGHEGIADFQKFERDGDEPLCFLHGEFKDTIAAYVPSEY